MTVVRINCINKDTGNHENPHVAISHLGWTNMGTGEGGRSTRLEMYNYIKEGGQAYVEDPKDGSKAYLEALTTPIFGTKYVRTRPNDTGRDNLLSLMECR